MEKLVRSERWQMQKVEEGHFVLVPLIAAQADLRAVLEANESAATIWDALAQPRTRGEILEKLEAEAWSDLPSGWRAEVEQCLAQLLELGAVSPCAPPLPMS